ncbi:ABC transporter substrate-binding protein [Nonomuraea sp. NBC_01738]|uniref:ABC transporter substrate-binding protein n=1 Tax=Nonomuraea sp. NBC_01738 TaxID=2976003 RepID=UPI002E0F723A|nr:ABC transporter substrate-binding protein [Nonomuraea sp. NBC_01738]
MVDLRLSRRGLFGLTLGTAAAMAVGCRSATEVAGGGTGGSGITLAYSAAPDPTKLMRRTIDSPVFSNLVFDRLVDLDKKTMEPVPWLAREWEYDQARTTLVLKLRDDALFHSGKKLTAEDVVFSLKKAQDPKAGAQVAPMLNRIEEIRASAPGEVTLKLKAVTSNLFDALMFSPVVEAASYDQGKVIGTGPYTWGAFSAGNKLDLARFDGYWDGAPSIEAITIRAIKSPQAQLSALQSGQVQMVGGIPARDVKTAAAGGRYTVSVTTPSYQQTYLGVDVKTKPFDDPKVRQALQYAVDRKRIADQVYGGYAEVSSLPWPATTPGVTPDQVTRYAHDPDKAKALLKEAGATGAEITVWAAQTPIFSSVLDIVQYDLTQAGFKVTPKLLDATEFQTLVVQSKLPGLNIANIGLVSVSPLTGISTANPARPGDNTSRLDDEKYVKLQERAFAAGTPEQLAEANHDLSEYLLEQSFHITLAQAHEVVMWDPSIQGHDTSFLGYLDLADARRGK